MANPGGAGMYLGVLNYVAVYTTIRERPLYTAAIGIVWGTGTILGPVVGGAFVSLVDIRMLSVTAADIPQANSSATWRWLVPAQQS